VCQEKHTAVTAEENPPGEQDTESQGAPSTPTHRERKGGMQQTGLRHGHAALPAGDPDGDGPPVPLPTCPGTDSRRGMTFSADERYRTATLHSNTARKAGNTKWCPFYCCKATSPTHRPGPAVTVPDLAGYGRDGLLQGPRTIESLRLEKTSKIIKSNHQPNNPTPAKPCPQLPDPHMF